MNELNKHIEDEKMFNEFNISPQPIFHQQYYQPNNNTELSNTTTLNKMATVVKHLPYPAQPFSYTNLHVETSVEVVANRIFVGGLSDHIGEDDLNEVFGAYGKIQNSRIIRNLNNTSKGYGFVTFVDEASATKVKYLALEDPKKFTIHNCAVVVKDARKKGLTKHVARYTMPSFSIPPQGIENIHQQSNTSTPQQNPSSTMYGGPVNECQQVGEYINRNQTGSPQQFLTPPPTPEGTNNMPPSSYMPTSPYMPPYGYVQTPYPYYVYNGFPGAYCQMNPGPYPFYQYPQYHAGHHQFQYTHEEPPSYESKYDSSQQGSPIVTIESEDDE